MVHLLRGPSTAAAAAFFVAAASFMGVGVEAQASVARNVSDPACSLAKGVAGATTCTVRTYYVAAEEVEWDYAPSGFDHFKGTTLKESEAFTWTVRYTNRIGSIYKKALYFEYTDESFTNKKEKPEHLGMLGPTIRAEVGEVVKVVFKNKASLPYGIHSHGVRYSAADEGAAYTNASAAAVSGAVAPGESWTYTWIVNDRAGPGPADGNSTVWAYHPHTTDTFDIYAGLIGALIVYKPGVLSPSTNLPTDVSQEFILLFLVINENLSHYLRDNVLKYAPELSDRLPPNPETPFELGGDTWTESNLMHAVNGRVFSNLDGLVMEAGSKVRWHLLGMGTEVDIHSVHWHSMTLLWNGHRMDTIELFPATFRTLESVPDTPGTWVLHCHVGDHMMAGMNVLYQVREPNSQTPILNTTAFIDDKTAMNVPAAPRPPLAAPIYSLNHAGRTTGVSVVGILVAAV
ncbi:hypothetical protein HK102_014137, partial [Quaeritorhiza haematococci]